MTTALALIYVFLMIGLLVDAADRAVDILEGDDK